MGRCRLRPESRGPTFVRRRGTSCMSPSPLCGEIGRSRHFTEKHNSFSTKCLPRLSQGLGDTDCLREPPDNLLRASWSSPESFLRVSLIIWVDILTKSKQNHTFFKTGHVWKIQTCQFLEKKPPEAQRQRQPGAFQKRPCLKTYLHKINWFSWYLEKVILFKKMLWLMEIYRSKSKFYWKPKWSVWSIWTYSTGWIFKLVTQKLSYRRKLKIEDFEKKWKISFGTQNGLLRFFPRPKWL